MGTNPQGRTMYRIYFETEKKKKESLAQGQKRKAAENYLEQWFSTGGAQTLSRGGASRLQDGRKKKNLQFYFITKLLS